MSGMMRGFAGIAGALLAGVMIAAVVPAADGGAATVAARGAAGTVRLSGPVAGQFLPVKVLSFTGLTSVYCTSASDCLAVGARQASGNDPELNQVLLWNGSKWRLSPVPQPGGRGSGGYNSLDSVRCLTARDCWAVGYYAKGDADHNEALHWNGTKWSNIATPSPDGTFGDSELNDVVCTSHANCWAVGELGPQGATQSEALHWNGRKWSFVLTPDQHGVSTGDTTILNAVRCSSASSCLAVGYFEAPATFATTNESLRWNGKKWSRVKTVDPGGTTSDSANELTGLACSSAVNCWAAGSIGTVSTQTSLNQLLQWNGKRWFEVQIPDPNGTGTGADNALIWDTCLSARDCWAVGTYGPDNSTTVDLRNQALHWNGAKWSEVKAPDPDSSAHAGVNLLLGARCATADNCWAVGVQELCNNLYDEILHWNGKKWFSADDEIDASRPVPQCPEEPRR